MTDHRISTRTAARLNGDSPGTYRAALSDYLPRMGTKKGNERQLDGYETAGLRLLTELSSSKLSLKEAAHRVAGLMPFLREIALGAIGGGTRYVFAVELWGRVGAEYRRAGYVCDGAEMLAECVRQAGLGEWPNIRIVNLTAIVAETVAGWPLAIGDPDAAFAELTRRIADKPAEVQRFELDLFEEIRERMDPAGGRRKEPPSKTDWRWYEPAAPSAAA